MIKTLGADVVRNETILVARVLLVLLFLIFGWHKMISVSSTMDYFASMGLPLPGFAAIIAIVVELVFGVAILLGVFTRPVALLLAVYTIVTALIGHRYWTMTGGGETNSMIHFYKNVSIAGGLMLLYITGPGKYSIDGRTNILPDDM